MLCLFTAGFQTMSIYNSPLLLVFYSLLGLRAKTPARPLVIFFFGSLKQPVYFCRLACSTFQIKHHHPSVVFAMFSNSLSKPFGELLYTVRTTYFVSLAPLKAHTLGFLCLTLFWSQAGLCFLHLCFSALVSPA